MGEVGLGRETMETRVQVGRYARLVDVGLGIRQDGDSCVGNVLDSDE